MSEFLIMGEELTGKKNLFVRKQLQDWFAGGHGSMALGKRANASALGQISLAANSASHQKVNFIAHTATTTTGAVNMNPDGGVGNDMILRASSAWAFNIQIAMRNTTDDEFAYWEARGMIERDGANLTALVGAVSLDLITETAARTKGSVAITADDTLEALQIAVTGAATTNIDWTAVVHIAEVL